MSKKSFFQKPSFRFFLVRSFVVCCFILLAARLVYVQGMISDTLDKRAKRQVPRTHQPNRPRYTITDRHNLSLAETVQVHSCFVDPQKITYKKRTAKYVGHALGVDWQALYKKMKKSKGRFLWVRRDVPANVVSRIKNKNLDGVGFKLEFRRHYPQGTMATHLLGLVGVDGYGLSGIEQKLNHCLKVKKSPHDKKRKTDLPAGNIRLTMDSQIQKIAERELNWGMKKTNAKKGMILIQEPHTGKILAMSTLPALSLDPDHPPLPTELRIPVLSDVFEPGSTFKIVVAAAALEENLVNPSEIFSGEKGAWNVADITIHDHHPRRRMTFDDIIIYSSNIGPAKLANRVGSERLYQYARSFGFGVYPGSRLSGEAKGVLRNPKRWSGISKNVISFGQEVGVTAMQLLGAYSAIANGGVLMEPKVLESIVSDSGRVIWRCEPTSVRRVVSEQTASKLTTLLTEVVKKGSGKNAQVRWAPGTFVAGKTGTAQKYDSSVGSYRNDLSIISFAGFFPSVDPKFTMLVILDEPEGRRWGGSDAAPIFRRIAEQILDKNLS